MEYYCCFVVFFVTLQKKEMDNKQATLELGTKPVGKLLMQYAIPAIIAMTASSLYNMVERLSHGREHIGQYHYAEYNNRSNVWCYLLDVSRSHTSFLWSKRSDDSICSRLYGDNIAWQCHHPSILRYECRVALGQQTTPCHVCYHVYRGA